MPHEPSLIVRVRQGSRVERQLRDDPPALVQAGSVSLDPVTAPSSGSGVIEPPSPGQVVYALPSPEGLVRERDELRHAISGAPHGPEPLVIVIEAANALREDELEAAVHAADTSSRAVILTILRDGWRYGAVGLTRATVPPVRATRSVGAIGNTEDGVPAAAHTVS
jgi:hypothetical protein